MRGNKRGKGVEGIDEVKELFIESGRVAKSQSYQKERSVKLCLNFFSHFV